MLIIKNLIKSTAVLFLLNHCVFAFADEKLKFSVKGTPARITLDLQEADVRSVIRLFSDTMHRNFVVHPKVGGKVSLRLNDVSLEEAFEVFLRLENLYELKNGDVAMIYPLGEVPLQ